MTIERIMMDIGCPAHFRGYDAVYYSIKDKLENNSRKITDTYTRVSKILDCTPGAVECNIRHLIEHMLKKGDGEKITNYFGSALPSDGGLTNKQFIWTLAKRVEKELSHVNNGR